MVVNWKITARVHLWPLGLTSSIVESVPLARSSDVGCLATLSFDEPVLDVLLELLLLFFSFDELLLVLPLMFAIFNSILCVGLIVSAFRVRAKSRLAFTAWLRCAPHFPPRRARRVYMAATITILITIK